MKLQKEFIKFFESIKIDESQMLKDKRDILQRDIEDKLPDILKKRGVEVNKSDMRFIDQGSYKYHTTISSKVIDRDVAVIIPIDKEKYADTRKIKEDLEKAVYHSSRTISFKEPCIRVSYFEDGKEYMHIDLPLYANYRDKFYLARGKRNSDIYEWEEADQYGLNTFF